MGSFEEEMSGDEVFALVASLAIGAFAAAGWYLRGLRTVRLGGSMGWRAALLLAPPVGLAVLWGVLASWSAVEVRTDVRYQLLFAAMGLVWAFLLPRALAFIGVSYGDDALERRNGAAAAAVTGTVAGCVLVFTGSNVGEGPSIWNTVATALAATTALFGCSFVLARSTALADAIAVERDVATGVRFAGWIAACGLVLGQAAAGNWVSTAAMFADLAARGWPVLGLLVIALFLERSLRPRESDPRPSVFAAGVLPAAAYLALAALHALALAGWLARR
jgi:hypothetical protein